MIFHFYPRTFSREVASIKKESEETEKVDEDEEWEEEGRVGRSLALCLAQHVRAALGRKSSRIKHRSLM